MKARLSKQQVKMLLDGKSLTFGRTKLVIPKEGEVSDELRKWHEYGVYHKRFDVIVDTAEMSISFEEKRRYVPDEVEE
jgi:hypothetical protein